jgi:hypothetical protein
MLSDLAAVPTKISFIVILSRENFKLSEQDLHFTRSKVASTSGAIAEKYV